MARPLNFKDRVGDGRILDEGLIGRIEQDQRLVLEGVIHPALELLAAGNSSGGVVGETEIDQINRGAGQRRGEIVGSGDGQVAQAAVLPSLIGITGAACHHVAVDIHRIDRIGHGDAIAFAKDVEDVAAIALGAVGDKDLLGADVTAAALEIVFGNGLTQPGVALLRPVAMEAFAGSHLVDGVFHRVPAGLRQGLGDIANAQADQGGVGIGLAERLDPPANFREQVTGFELEVIAVDEGHREDRDGGIVLCGAPYSRQCYRADDRFR